MGDVGDGDSVGDGSDGRGYGSDGDNGDGGDDDVDSDDGVMVLRLTTQPVPLEQRWSRDA